MDDHYRREVGSNNPYWLDPVLYGGAGAQDSFCYFEGMVFLMKSRSIREHTNVLHDLAHLFCEAFSAFFNLTNNHHLIIVFPH